MSARSLVRRVVLGLCLATVMGASPVHAAGRSDPRWSDLKAAEQRVLSPLQEDWDRLDAARKRKWIAVARKYPSMKPDEQARVQERMQAWAALTPEQRRAARENFRRHAQLPAEQRETIAQRWEEYQQGARVGMPSAPTGEASGAGGQVVPTAARE